MSLLEEQSLELLLRQLLYLDADSIDSTFLAFPEIERRCDDERFWREMVRVHYPEFTAENYKETFRLLTYSDVSTLILLDRPDLLELLHSSHTVTTKNVRAAVDASCPGALNWLLKKHRRRNVLFTYEYFTALSSGEPKLVKAFIANGRRVKTLDVITAAKYGEERVVDVLLDHLPDRPLRLFADTFYRICEEGSRNFRKTIKRLDSRGELSPTDEACIAVFLDDAQRFTNTRTVIPFDVACYGFRFGSDALVRELTRAGYLLGHLDEFSLGRVKRLRRLGVSIDTDRLYVYKMSEKIFFYLIGAGVLDVNKAAAVVFQRDDLDTYSLVEGLLKRRDKLPLCKKRVKIELQRFGVNRLPGELERLFTV